MEGEAGEWRGRARQGPRTPSGKRRRQKSSLIWLWTRVGSSDKSQAHVTAKDTPWTPLGELVSHLGWEDTVVMSVAAVLNVWGHVCHAPVLIFAFVSAFGLFLFAAAPQCWLRSVSQSGCCFRTGVHFVSRRMTYAPLYVWLFGRAAPTGCPWSRGDRLLAATR